MRIDLSRNFPYFRVSALVEITEVNYCVNSGVTAGHLVPYLVSATDVAPRDPYLTLAKGSQGLPKINSGAPCKYQADTSISPAGYPTAVLGIG